MSASNSEWGTRIASAATLIAAPEQINETVLLTRRSGNCWRFIGTRACTRTDAEDVLTLLATGALHAENRTGSCHRLDSSETSR
ncbi:hypothetical protein [Nocardia sp. NPDC004604]|uniref:hypothetical protein n=1 Tax=Nocardia sp. NPDC004604 TaxID=3157013 RepID=UPI0033B57745